ncbi:tRNA(Ile)-lysidine synthase [Faecalicatena contorta]|uniref:tRNA(Ile)-lysidine synthase n=2 Tax=Faecalicatena contorta TaxID=39482 RepID=A0A315ZUE8_9FIRM|nr:tRNA(Ile)-lysidine synthase [Faecalicatena contorta]SUQ14891.1 tRNA(Ile)-lysidine synthase [Faecalicatena contorta]
MIADRDRVIAGISGGADSVCLLFVLLELRKTMDIEIIAVHVNHGIREETAGRDEQFVQELCEEHQVECVVYHENVELIAKKRKQSVEEAGRIVRREAFEETFVKYQGTKIAMAHHQNDNAETLLMNLARGTGLKGLGGIRPVNGYVIRPLLCLNRREIEIHLQKLGRDYCRDETNEEDDYTRNRLRHFVVPILEEQVNAQAVRHMNEAMEQIRQVWDYMEMQTESAYESCVAETPDGNINIKEEAFSRQPEVLQKLLVRACLARAAGSERNITMAHVEAVAELFHKQSGKSRNLPYSVKAFRNYEGVALKKAGEDQEAEFCPRELKIPGVTVVPELNLEICCTILEKTEDFSIKHVPQKAYTKWFDYDIIKSNLIVRTRRSKDSIIIDQAGRRQKIKSYFINEKIPAEIRKKLPLIADDGQIIWILGYRMSSAYQVTGKTRQILEIKVTEEKMDVGEN